MDIIQLNNQIEEFVNKYDFSHDALALKQEHAIQKSEEWQRVLDSLRPLQNSFPSNSRNPNKGFQLFSPPITPDSTQIPP